MGTLVLYNGLSQDIHEVRRNDRVGVSTLHNCVIRDTRSSVRQYSPVSKLSVPPRLREYHNVKAAPIGNAQLDMLGF